MAQATVRLLALGGGWETVGRDRLRGIYPEGITLSANAWGSDTARFTLRRDPTMVHPDLSAFTPCEIEVDGVVVWSGRVWETPTKEGSDAGISVEGRGWQYHLDDDVYDRLMVLNRLDGFVDTRSLNGAALTTYQVPGNVQNDSGQIILTWTRGTVMGSQAAVGISFDFGPDPACWPKRITMNWHRHPGGNASQSLMWARAADGQDGVNVASGSFEDFLNGVTVFNASTTLVQSVGTLASGTARRYLHIFLYNNSGAAYTPGGDDGIVITDFKAFGGTNWDASFQSILKVTDIIKDALPHAPLLNQDTSLISQTAFSVPEAVWFDNKTPREIITAYNALHNYRTRVEPDARLRFDPYPSVPKYEAGAWQGIEFEDASANSGETIYNRAIVEATDAAGSPLRIVRMTGQQFTDSLAPEAGITLPNASFTSSVAGWDALPLGSATFTRTTTAGQFDSTPAGGQLTVQSGVQSSLRATFNGTFLAGRTYVLTMRMSVSPSYFFGGLRLGKPDQSDYAFTQWDFMNNAWSTYTIAWAPRSDTSSAQFWMDVNAPSAGTTTIWVDTFQLWRSTATLMDKRGFVRTMILPISSAMNAGTGSQIADVFLSNHKTTPLRGGAAVALGGFRPSGGGGQIHPSTLLINSGELVRFTNRVDPDTGSYGRDGRIASVTYDHATELATVEIDNERRNFEALLSRYSALVGG